LKSPTPSAAGNPDALEELRYEAKRLLDVPVHLVPIFD